MTEQQVETTVAPYAKSLLQLLPVALLHTKQVARSAAIPEVEIFECIATLLYAGGHRSLFSWAGLGPNLEEVVSERARPFTKSAKKLLARRGQLLEQVTDGRAAIPRAVLSADILEFALDVIRLDTRKDLYDEMSPIIEDTRQVLVSAQTAEVEVESTKGEHKTMRVWPSQTGRHPCLTATHAAVVALSRCVRESRGCESPYKLLNHGMAETEQCLRSAATCLESYLSSGHWFGPDKERGSSALLPQQMMRLALSTHSLLEIEGLGLAAVQLKRSTLEHAAGLLVENAIRWPHILAAPMWCSPVVPGRPDAPMTLAELEVHGGEQRDGISITLRAMADVYRFYAAREAEARQAGWLFEVSFARQRARSAILMLGDLLSDLSDPVDSTWWAGRFDARSNLRAVVALTESAEAIWGASKRGIEGRGGKDSAHVFEVYEAAQRALWSEEYIRSTAALIAREVERARKDEGESD